ncbi:MAG: sigma-54-dependent Fis family transcriptional regulator [Acidobacteria bacterium]|nr:sigma-54-dependent Fis family transcriptional regulator [Acidobacteriota bacterium]
MNSVSFVSNAGSAPDRVPSGDGSSSPTQLRFRTLVQSPLRAGLLRYLHARPGESFELESLMQTFGRMRLDIDACLQGLVSAGVAERTTGVPARYLAKRPGDALVARLLDDFLRGQPDLTTEEQSPSVQRFREMIGRDEKMLLVFESIRTVSKTDLSVLVLGPTGSGKEVAARMIHELSRRRDANFQAVNCAALPDTLFESEVFGYEKGAFTGANDRKPGRIELANHGTLFLDEIGDLSLVAQAKMLRVLEDRRVERLGGRQAVEVDFRLISATHRPLDLFVGQERFREDLYYRVNAFTIRLPSLRERPGDIPVLAQRFLARYCAAQGLPLDALMFSSTAFQVLTQYHWPGNIRELEATVSRAAISARGRFVEVSDVNFLHAHSTRSADPAGAMPSLREVEQAHIARVLEHVGWNKKKAAQILQISRETLYRKIADYQLKPREGAAPRADGARSAAPAQIAG